MIRVFIYYILRSLICTILIESIVAYFIGIRKKDLLIVFIVNLITNPIVNIVSFLINLYYGLFYRNIVLFILEILAFLFEGIVYKKKLFYKKLNSFIISLILNMSWYGIGLIINYLF